MSTTNRCMNATDSYNKEIDKLSKQSNLPLYTTSSSITQRRGRKFEKRGVAVVDDDGGTNRCSSSPVKSRRKVIVVKKVAPWPGQLIFLLIVFFVAYFYLSWRTLMKSNHYSEHLHLYPLESISSAMMKKFVHDNGAKVFKQSEASKYASSWWKTKEEIFRKKNNARTKDRRRRTRPPTISFEKDQEYQHHLDWYPIDFSNTNSDTKGGTDTRTNIGEEYILANSTDICNLSRNVSINSPNNYLKRNVLNSESSVLITGILSPLGFHLALRLFYECDVESIAGVDHMFPNTIRHRLRVQQQIAILIKTIPKLRQPILIPLTGLDPKPESPVMSSNGILLLRKTGEFNYKSVSKITHIVHLMGSSVSSFHDHDDSRSGERKNTDSPYVSEERTHNPMFGIRQSLVGMEQLLTSLETMDIDKRSHFTFVSDTEILGRNNNDSGWKGYNGKRGEDESFHTSIKLMEEILSQAYGSLSGIESVGLRLSNVYGPWGMQGAFDHDIAEQAAVHWKGGYGMNERSEMKNSSSLLHILGYGLEESEVPIDFLFIDGELIPFLVVTHMFYRELLLINHIHHRFYDPE